ncbi:MAG: Ig-like domain repeat protein [Anaerolineales bacterium]|nr:Ig-like domain repeat protein [Anaerolineales bacterium]
MKILKFDPKKSKAQAIVEFAIVLPVLLLVVYGLIEVGRLLFIYSSINNATRQASRYGSTSGVGQYGVARYLDCVGIRESAQRVDFLNAFEDANINITYDSGPGTAVIGNCNGASYANDPGGRAPKSEDRIVVTIEGNYNTIVPDIVPLLSRTVAGGDPIRTESSRTLLLTISIPPPKVDTITEILSHLPNPSEVGQPVTVSVRVRPVSGTTIPSGTVNITGADVNCPPITLLPDGTGSCVVNFTTFSGSGDQESRTISAVYTGDDKHNPSGDNKSHTVEKAATEIDEIIVTPEPSLVGGTVTVSVKVISSNPWGGTPTGTVTVTGQDQGCAAPVTLSGGTGNCQVIFNSAGGKTLTATYTPDTPLFNGSQGTVNHSVDLRPTSTTINTVAPDSPPPGTAITVSVTVVDLISASTIPTGTVVVSSGDVATICTIPLSAASGGTGSCTGNIGASRTLTATYTPNDGIHDSSAGTKTVNQPRVEGCNTTNITVGLMEQTGGALTMTISNSLSTALQISNVTVQWNHDKGHQTGSDKTLILQSARLGSVFWTGNQIGPTYTITPAAPTYIPSGVSTLVFNFHQVFDRWDNTESITINLSTPGCEGVILFQNQHD